VVDAGETGQTGTIGAHATCVYFSHSRNRPNEGLMQPLRARRHVRRGRWSRAVPWVVTPGLIGALAIAGGAATTGGSATARPIVRLAGSDAFGTAAAVSAATFARGTSVAFIATGTAFPDALAGAAAAGGRGPVLLVTPTSVPSATATELARLAPQRVVVLGGTSAVSDSVASAVAADAGNAALTRVAGADRFGTAAAVSAATFAPGVATAYLATGESFPDALAGAAGAAGKGPILLVSGTSVPSTTAAELHRLAPKHLVVLGGQSSVADSTAKSAALATGQSTFTRLSGVDRYGTAVAVSSTFTAPVPVVYLATGLDFADALVGGAAAAGRGPMLLVSTSTLPDVVAGELRRLNARSTVVVGPSTAVSDRVAHLADAVTTQGIPAPSAHAQDAIASARAQLGKPYVWGGAGPAVFDCSGLTAYAWKSAGVTMPHNAAAQYDAITDIPISALQPGDLVFFGDPDPTHVGLYIGNGQMIEAAHSGVPVRISSIDRSNLIGAGRPRP
jgi:cell wall-associated NlpC family hydrolase